MYISYYRSKLVSSGDVWSNRITVIMISNKYTITIATITTTIIIIIIIIIMTVVII